MSEEMNKASALEFMERAFNQGELEAVDEHIAQSSVDHQEPLGTDFAIHLKQVITSLRTAFPDLHFEIHNILAEDDIVAFRSTMTGTHQGVLNIGAMRGLPPTGQKVSVPHMHFVRMIDGKAYDLWHVWDTPSMMRQLGVSPQPQQNPA